MPAVPVLAELRIFIPPDQWSSENVRIAAREICRVLGGTSQFDIGMTQAGRARYSGDRPASGDTARLMKLDASDTRVLLLVNGATGDEAFEARFPELRFEPAGMDYWRAAYGPGLVKEATQL